MSSRAEQAGNDHDLALGQVASEIKECLRNGHRPDVNMLVAKYPGLANQIRDIVAGLAMLDQFGEWLPSGAAARSAAGHGEIGRAHV